jgi:uncharacterized membrane protein
MAAVAHYIEVEAPAQACYDWWRPLTRLPEIFSDLRSVKPVDDDPKRTAWTVSGPAGKSVSWQARIVEDAPPHKIAWSSVDSADPDVKNAGVVRFNDKGNGTTGVEVSLEYDPPAGKLGETIAALFDDPQSKVERAVEEFKTIIETR